MQADRDDAQERVRQQAVDLQQKTEELMQRDLRLQRQAVELEQQAAQLSRVQQNFEVCLGLLSSCVLILMVAY